MKTLHGCPLKAVEYQKPKKALPDDWADYYLRMGPRMLFQVPSDSSSQEHHKLPFFSDKIYVRDP